MKNNTERDVERKFKQAWSNFEKELKREGIGFADRNNFASAPPPAVNSYITNGQFLVSVGSFAISKYGTS